MDSSRRPQRLRPAIMGETKEATAEFQAIFGDH